MEPVSSIDGIKRRLREISEMTEWSPVPLGNVLRASSDSYSNWGIAMTDSNADWIREQSQHEYRIKFKYSEEYLNSLIKAAHEAAGLGAANAMMTKTIGQYSANYISEILKSQKSIFIVNLSSESSTLGFMSELGKMDLKIPTLSLSCTEPSRLRARKNDNEVADIVVSNSSLHHSSFDHFEDIRRMLKPNAPLIIGDWYSGLSEKPERIYWLLVLLKYMNDEEFEHEVMMGISKGAMPKWGSEISSLKEFRKYFGLTHDMLTGAFSSKMKGERDADAGIIKFWLEVGKIFYPKGMKSPIHIIEGHERVSRRISCLESAGFCFDADSRDKYVNLLSNKGRGELATVMVAKKAKL